MSDNGQNSQDRILYIKTSMRIAKSMLTGYKKKHNTPISKYDLLYRLRVAHALLLKFHHYYFNLKHKAPHTDAQDYLVNQVLWPLSG